MLQSMIQEVHLLPGLPKTKRERDYRYLMELREENLLFPFYTEAGLNGRLNYKLENLHGGWDAPLSQIRGTFTGHWLSAAARIYNETKERRLKAKADFIVAEIARCQEANGGGWAFPIPEKFLYGLKNGRHFWAPQYVCHKVMMGLLDMYLFAGNEQALEILRGCADWFYRFTGEISREVMSDMMDLEETGGIMEFWGDLYAVTKDPRHLELARRYERPRLTEPLLQNVNVLTNFHANMTISEIQGCARAYEVTGEERFRRIVESYWRLAVDERGRFATGGQTNGEIWTPKNQFSARLGDMNQEHCTVYNMVRLADYLYRWTGDEKYADYIESNIWNGLFAQGFCEGHAREQCLEPSPPKSGLITYYLLLAAGSQKKWGSKTEDFWCCHCTLVQANARYREWIYYGADDGITVAQYFPSEAAFCVDGVPVTLEQKPADLCGDILEIHEISHMLANRPTWETVQFTVSTERPVTFALRLRLPRWIQGDPVFRLNGETVSPKIQDGYAVFERMWENDTLEAEYPKSVVCVSLPDKPDTVAFVDGLVVLAGLVPEERICFSSRLR